MCVVLDIKETFNLPIFIIIAAKNVLLSCKTLLNPNADVCYHQCTKPPEHYQCGR